MSDKKLVASTVSSRETGLKRRAETVTTCSHEDKKLKNKKKNGIHISFKSKDSKKIFFTGNKEEKTNKENRKAAARSKK